MRRIDWKPWLRFLGTAPDRVVSEASGICIGSIAYRRKILGIAAYRKKKPTRTEYQTHG